MFFCGIEWSPDRRRRRLDTIAIIDDDRIERMTMLNADCCWRDKTEAEEVGMLNDCIPARSPEPPRHRNGYLPFRQLLTCRFAALEEKLINSQASRFISMTILRSGHAY